MANLTEVSIATRKYLIWVVVVFVSYIILRFMFNFLAEYSKVANPIPIAPPDVRFDRLPYPEFTNILRSTSGLVFELRNIDGKPPETTKAAKVYQMPKKLPSLLSQEKAQEFAKNLGFLDDPVKIEGAIYYFADSKNPSRTLKLDSVNMNFNLINYKVTNPKILDKVYIESEERAKNQVENYLGLPTMFDDTVLKGKQTVDLLKYDTKTEQLGPATSLSNTQIVRVNFFRNDINELRVIPPGFNKSYTYALYSPIEEVESNILEVSYIFWPIDEQNFATYPLRSGQTAWQDLLDGYAIIVSMKGNPEEEVVIRDMYLAYYDSKEPQEYLQPIYVFEGDNDFIAYLPAILADWLE